MTQQHTDTCACSVNAQLLEAAKEAIRQGVSLPKPEWYRLLEFAIANAEAIPAVEAKAEVGMVTVTIRDCEIEVEKPAAVEVRVVNYDDLDGPKGVDEDGREYVGIVYDAETTPTVTKPACDCDSEHVNNLHDAARKVVEAWEGGNLAEAVNDLASLLPDEAEEAEAVEKVYPIIGLDRDSIEYAGHDHSGISEADMQDIADEVGNCMDSNGEFHEALSQVLKHKGIPELPEATAPEED